MRAFQILVAAAWLVVIALSVRAVTTMGADQAGPVFIGDFAHAWRAQFNGDFSMHILLMAAWMFYRQRGVVAGLVCAVCAVVFGGAFSLAYIFVASLKAQGSFARLLLGHRFETARIR